jgi:hypothetical protein
MVALGHWAADVSWHWALSYFVHKERKYLGDKLYRGIVRFLAAGLIATGIYFCAGISV